MSEHTKYRVVFDDPDALDEPTKVLSACTTMAR